MPELTTQEMMKWAESQGLEPPNFNGNGPTPGDDGQIFVKGWHWDETGLHRVKPDGTYGPGLNREVLPSGIVESGDTRCLELTVNGVHLRLSNSWVGPKSGATKVLSAHGLAFTDRQAGVLQEFVADALTVGVNLPVKAGAEALGWEGNELVLGQADDGLVFLPRDDSQHVHGFGKRAGGKQEARCRWQSLMESAPPSVWVGVGTACGSPMLSNLPDQYHVIITHSLGPKATGKTTIQRLGAAIFGDPHLLVSTWDTTHVGLERLLATCRHLPAFLDETGANARQENLGPLVMMVAGGVGRTRGAVDGMRVTQRWRNTVLSTGETSPTQGAVAGVYRRILLVHSALDSVDQVNMLDAVAEEYFGWPAFWLRSIWTERDRWAAEILAATSQYDSLLGDYPGAHKSQARAWAVVDAGARAFAEALELDPQLAIDAVEKVARETCEHQCDQLDPADRLIWAVADDLAMAPKAYQPENMDFKAAFKGRLISAETVAVLRTPLADMARRWGILDLDATLSTLKNKGCLVTDPGRLTKQVRMGGIKARCHIFKLAGFAGGDENVG